MASYAVGGDVQMPPRKARTIVTLIVIVIAAGLIAFSTFSILSFIEFFTWDSTLAGYSFENKTSHLIEGIFYGLLAIMPVASFGCIWTLQDKANLIVPILVLITGIFGFWNTFQQPSFEEWVQDRYGVAIQEVDINMGTIDNGEKITSADGARTFSIHQDDDTGRLFLFNKQNTSELSVVSDASELPTGTGK